MTESNLYNAKPYNPVTKGSKYFDQRILKFLFNKDENGIMRLPLMLNTEIANLLLLNLVERVRRQQVVIFEKGDLQKKVCRWLWEVIFYKVVTYQIMTPQICFHQKALKPFTPKVTKVKFNKISTFYPLKCWWGKQKRIMRKNCQSKSEKFKSSTNNDHGFLLTSNC